MTSVTSIRAEIAGIDSQLEDWFMERKLKLERAVTLKKVLEKHNFTGLSQQSQVNSLHAALWRDIVCGRPHIDASLSSDAKLRKADAYVELFDNASDAEHPCRASGMTYLRCLQKNFKSQGLCDESFGPFEQCRSQIIKQQDEVLKTSMRVQDTGDRRAKELFSRRLHLLDQLNSTANKNASI